MERKRDWNAAFLTRSGDERKPADAEATEIAQSQRAYRVQEVHPHRSYEPKEKGLQINDSKGILWGPPEAEPALQDCSQVMLNPSDQSRLTQFQSSYLQLVPRSVLQNRRGS